MIDSTPSVAGNNILYTSSWQTYGAVPDVKSHGCKLRVTDADNSSVTIDSNAFSVYPKITNFALVPSAGDEGSNPVIWRAGLNNQTVNWTESSSKVTSVNIYYRRFGGAEPGTLIANTTSNDASGNQTCAAITAPTDLYERMILRVRDSDPLFVDDIYADSAEFRTLGRIVFGASPAEDDNWFIGDTNRTVNWTSYGDQIGSVDILISYNDGLNFTYLASPASVNGASSSWTFDDPLPEVTGIGDHVTNNAIVRIEDPDAVASLILNIILPLST